MRSGMLANASSIDLGAMGELANRRGGQVDQQLREV
jgi:hypothetical protein